MMSKPACRALLLLMLAAVTWGLFLSFVQYQYAHAATEAATRTVYVHKHPGIGAWMQTPAHLVAAPGSRAARKINRAHPADVYRLRHAKTGRFQVVGITSSTTAKLAGFDLRMHVQGTSMYVFCNRVHW